MLPTMRRHGWGTRLAIGLGLAWGCGGDDGGSGDTTGASSGSTSTNGGDTVSMTDGPGPTSQGPADSTDGGTDPDSTGDPTGDDTTGGPILPGPLVVYVADGDQLVHAFSADDAGALTSIDTYDAGNNTSQLAVHPDGLHLYATARNGGTAQIVSYEIDPSTGALTQLGATDVGISPVYLGIDPTGQVAMIADFGGDAIEAYAIGGDAVVTPGTTHAQAVGDEPHCILTDPSGAHAYVPHRGTNDIWQFSLDAGTGVLTPLNPPTVDAAPGAGARHLAFHPSGEHAYLSDEFSDTMTHFTRDPASGQLTRQESVSSIPMGFDGGMNTTADVHVSPDGAYAYISNRGHDSLAMFAIDAADGTLTELGQVATEPTPREFDVEPGGAFVYAAGQTSGQLAGYALDSATGMLDPIGTTPIGGSPLWVLGVRLPSM